MYNLIKLLILPIALVLSSQVLADKHIKQPRVSKPIFSHETGFYPEEFELVISHANPDAIIYYTLDGSEPDPNNLNGTTYRYKNEYQQPPKKEGDKLVIKDNFLYNEYKTYQYSQPILIKDRTFEPDRISQISTTFDAKPNYFPKPKPANTWRNTLIDWLNKPIELLEFILNKSRDIYYKYKLGNPKPSKNFIDFRFNYLDYTKSYTYKGTPIRAIATLPNSRPSKTTTHTLFIGSQEQFSLPIIAITIPEKDLFDYDTGKFVAGLDYDNFVKEGMEVSGAKHHRPSNWKGSKNKYTNGNLAFLNSNSNFDIKLKAHGDGSKAARLKSIRVKSNTNIPSSLVFNSIYSFDKKLTYFNLRNAGQASKHSFIKDAALQKIVYGLAIGTQDYSPKIIFINGEYNGLLNARERRDNNYVSENFNVNKNSINLIKGGNQVQHGSKEDWNRFDEYILKENPLSESYKLTINSFIDLQSWADYFITEIYYANEDWPAKNMAFWKSNTDLKNKGKWRWLLFDLDASFSNYAAEGNAHFNGMKYINRETKGSNPDWATRPIYKPLKNKDIKIYFINRFSDLINTTFLPSRTKAIIHEIQADIEVEMPRHIERWQAPKSIEHWHYSINNIINFLEKRPAIQRQHLQEFFKLGKLYTAAVNVNNKQAGTVKLNTLHLGLTDDELEKPLAASARATHMTAVLAFPWQGEYFADLPLNLEAIAKEGYTFSHWEVEGYALNKDLTQNKQLSLQPKKDLKITAFFIPN